MGYGVKITIEEPTGDGYITVDTEDDYLVVRVQDSPDYYLVDVVELRLAPGIVRSLREHWHLEKTGYVDEEQEAERE